MADLALSQQLNQWKTQLNTITNNLMDLYAAESTKSIRTQMKDPVHAFSGVTKAKAARAIELLDDLVELTSRLATVVDEASNLLSKGGVFRNNEQRVKALLDGQSVVLQTQHLSLRNRGLLDEGNREVRATPAEVLAHMEQSFAEARDAITAIADAMAHIQARLVVLRQERTALDGWAKTLGLPRPTALADDSLPILRLESDPLGCTTEVDAMSDALVQWRTKLHAADVERKAIFASLERGKATLAELRDLARRSGTAFAEAREKIMNPEGLVPQTSDETVKMLDTWLKTLEQNAAAGRFAAVKVGMAKWEQTCSPELAAVRTGYARNTAGLDERTELRGRFKALSAKADTLRSRGLALGDEAEAASRQGEAVLDALPFDLSAARRLVRAFEAALSGARK